MHGQNGLEMCVICLEENPLDISSAKECMHIFCSSCLLAWFKLKPVCPLCSIESQTIISQADGKTLETDVKLILVKPESVKAVDALDLDHSYFKNEIGKLEKKAKAVRQKMGTMLSHKSKDETPKWRYLEYLENELFYFSEEIKKYRKFDQTQFLKDLLWIDGQYKFIEFNNWSAIDLSEFDMDFSREIFFYENEDDVIKKSQEEGDIASQFFVKEVKSGKGKKKSNKNKKN